MSRLTLRLWEDERGEISFVAVILITSLLAIGAIVGLTVLRNQIIQEFGDLAVALDHLDQSYSVDYSAAGCTDFSFTDTSTLTDLNGQPPAGISLTETTSSEAGGVISNTPEEN